MANDFSSDGNCVALYRFENGALTTDSKNGNTLSTIGSPTADVADFKEGSAAVDLEPTGGNDGFQRADALLSADFPFKNGTANKTISIAVWAKIESHAAARVISGKWSSGSIGSYALYTDGSGNLKLTIYDGASSSETYTYGTALSLSTWYHIGVTYQDSDKSYRLRVWDDSASALLDADLTGNGTKNIGTPAAAFGVGQMGGSYYWDGWLDELVVFNDVLSADEIDQIRGATYGNGGGGGDDSPDAIFFGTDF